MKNTRILDSILHSYLYGQKLKLEGNPLYYKMTFEYIFKSTIRGENYHVEPWQMEFLKLTLLNDGFIRLPDSGIEPYELTTEGIKAAQISWYSKSVQDIEIEKEIKSLTISDLKRSKKNLTVAILALIIPTILSVYSVVETSKNNKEEEIENLKNELKQIKAEIDLISKKENKK